MGSRWRAPPAPRLRPRGPPATPASLEIFGDSARRGATPRSAAGFCLPSAGGLEMAPRSPPVTFRPGAALRCAACSGVRPLRARRVPASPSRPVAPGGRPAGIRRVDSAAGPGDVGGHGVPADEHAVRDADECRADGARSRPSRCARGRPCRRGRARSRAAGAGSRYMSESETSALRLVPSPEFCMSTTGRAAGEPGARRPAPPRRPPAPLARRAAADASPGRRWPRSIERAGYSGEEVVAFRLRDRDEAVPEDPSSCTMALISAQAR